MAIPTGVACACGRVHEPLPTKIIIRAGAVESLPILAGELAEGVPLVLFDPVTHRLAGENIARAFIRADKPWERLVLGSESAPFEPNEATLEAVRATIKEKQPGLVAGVGAGAMNDLGKFVAHEAGLPYISVATAPSMDGYMAPISALLIGGVKVTYDTKAPDGVIADLDVLAGAPMSLVSAGFADVVGKLTSLRDWELARVLFGEYWCRAVSDHVEGIASRLFAAAGALAERSHDSVRLLMEGLLEAGISVFHVGSSRPTSGSEHLVSHYVEMRRFNEGGRPPAHGHVVGFGMLVIAELAEKMRGLRAEDVRKTRFTPADMEQVLAELRLDEVPGNFGKSKFDAEIRDARLPVIASRWDDILAVLEKVPPAHKIREGLARVGAPTNLRDLGLDPETAMDTVLHARYMRERYTMLDLAAELGVLEAQAANIVRKYA